MPTSTLWTTGWTTREGSAIEPENSKEDFGGTQGKNHSDPGVEQPVRDARVRFFWGWSLSFYEMISREDIF